jgi:glucose-1-phosphatase
MQPLPPVRAVLLDLGNVVFEASFASAFTAWTGSPVGASDSRIAGLLGLPCFAYFETATIGAGEFHAAVTEYLDLDMDQADFFRGWNSIYGEPVRGIAAILDDLKRNGTRIFAFTNTNAAHAPVWKRKYGDLLARFEGIFESQVMGLRKPDPHAFLHVASEMRMPEEEILFVDDVRKNAAAARSVGMQSIWLPVGMDLRRELAIRRVL